MICMICNRGLSVGDEIVKIIHAKITSNNGGVICNNLADEGILHANCLKNLIENVPDEEVVQTVVERTDILSFLGD